jgi:hypothetical protein
VAIVRTIEEKTQRGNRNPTSTKSKIEKRSERKRMKRMNHNITFRDVVEVRLQRIFDEWEEWPDRPFPPRPYIPPTGTLPNTRKYELDCSLFRGVQIGKLVQNGSYKRAYIKARIKELRTEVRNLPESSMTELKYKVFEFGDYVRIKVREFYYDPETGERKER